MRKLGGILVVVLLLSGCAATPEPGPVTSASETPPAPAALEFEDVETLDDGITYAQALTPESVGLADEISQTAQKLGDLVVDADLPWDVNNAIGSDLLRLNAAVLDSPDEAATQLVELHRIADEIAAAV